MPVQKITVEIPTLEITEDERNEAAVEIARAVQGVLLAYLESRDALQAVVTQWVEQ